MPAHAPSAAQPSPRLHLRLSFAAENTVVDVETPVMRTSHVHFGEDAPVESTLSTNRNSSVSSSMSRATHFQCLDLAAADDHSSLSATSTLSRHDQSSERASRASTDSTSDQTFKRSSRRLSKKERNELIEKHGFANSRCV
jgi:hypothetical protein